MEGGGGSREAQRARPWGCQRKSLPRPDKGQGESRLATRNSACSDHLEALGTSNLSRAGQRREHLQFCSKPCPVELLKFQKKKKKRGRSKGKICKLDLSSILLNHQKLLENSIRVLTPQMLEIPAWKACEAIACPPCTREGGGGAEPPNPRLVYGLSPHTNRRPGGTSGSPDMCQALDRAVSTMGGPAAMGANMPYPCLCMRERDREGQGAGREGG